MRSASITYMIRHYVARRAQVTGGHPHNATMRVQRVDSVSQNRMFCAQHMVHPVRRLTETESAGIYRRGWIRIGRLLRSVLAGGPECRPPHLLVQRSATVYLFKRMSQLSLLRANRVTA